ncbi:MAG: beta-aspartyl-peptidase [Acidobacteria bacterium]|nr:MAG: beta-aspartyl-peptidase [Acidobacteriota bacterium]
MSKIALAIHGGAGTILRSTMTPELEREYRAGLETALNTGWQILESGGSALDAVEQTVCSLEDFHLFNAGRGSVFTHDGKNEMDASIMDGRTLDAGAIAFVRNVKNPITLARLVMEKTPHILLAADGANQFAKEMAVDFAPDEYFFTEHRWQQLLKAREEGIVQLDHAAEEQESVEDAEQKRNPKSKIQNPKSLGTVGAVACDAVGNLAAATSTGGMTNKKFGRVGDTALIGAGTYAENATCAVSCTGHGEFFMMGVTAYDVAARMKYRGIDLSTAAKQAIEHLTDIGGEGGFIAVDGSGNVVLPFNSDGMYRGHRTADSSEIEIYR